METIKIGGQVWDSNNSLIRTFSNGDEIFQCKNQDEWIFFSREKIPACCYYDFDDSNEKFGLLYNGYVLLDQRELGTEGFRAANYVDWFNLEYFIGGKDFSDDLKSVTGWNKIESNGEKETSVPIQYSDKYGFNSLPSGWVNENGVFYQKGSISKYWTSTKDDDLEEVWARIIGYKFTKTTVKPGLGFSIRLIKT